MPPQKPVPYPGDQYIKDMIAQQGYVKPDDNRNIILAQNVTVVDSVHNTITADNAILENSHDCLVSAKNVEIRNCVEVNAQGADHLIGTPNGGVKNGEEANYSTTIGDAHTVRGYAAFTAGEGNKNFIYCGICVGNNIVMGEIDKPNELRYSTARGSFIEIQGSHCNVTGSWIKVVGDNITVIGNGTPGTFMEFTTPGVHIINQQP